MRIKKQQYLRNIIFKIHNIGEIGGEPMISNSDTLIADPGYRYDYTLTIRIPEKRVV